MAGMNIFLEEYVSAAEQAVLTESIWIPGFPKEAFSLRGRKSCRRNSPGLIRGCEDIP